MDILYYEDDDLVIKMIKDDRMQDMKMENKKVKRENGRGIRIEDERNE